eukprot:5153727-Amphidinium_carterae.1
MQLCQNRKGPQSFLSQMLWSLSFGGWWERNKSEPQEALKGIEHKRILLDQELPKSSENENQEKV